MAAFAQIGPPTNLSVDISGDEVKLSWMSPEFGNENFGTYVVRWFKEPEHELKASWETRNNFYSSKKFF